jgi:sulfite exporter TauE/SafE/copper chaperone CopZ
MPDNLRTKVLKIGGMTCVNCESRIERKLQGIRGIVSAKASYSACQATITFDEGEINLKDITALIEQLDYKVIETLDGTSIKSNGIRVLGVAFIIFAVYLGTRRLIDLGIFNSFPVVNQSMSYGMLLIIGLLTSVHCVAMCGGINLSQCAKQQSAFSTDTTKSSPLRPSLLYNSGRVISYTVIGGLVGAVGSVVSFSGAAKGIVQLAAGLFMVIMGLNMLNIFPWLHKLNPRIPRFFARKSDSYSNGRGPFYIGLLNGLMPCGPLQAMQLYALSTGSAIGGAFSMFLFSMGTVPLRFGLGALSSFLSKKFTSKMMTVSAVLVVALGIFMFGNGMSLSGFVTPTLAAEKESSNVAQLAGGIQTVRTTLFASSYEPIVVQKGIPVKWIIRAEANSINGCNYKIIIPKYRTEKKLEPGDNVIEFTPTESGVVPFSCWMGMIKSSITVVDSIEALGTGTVKSKPIENVPGVQNVIEGTGPSCCN